MISSGSKWLSCKISVTSQEAEGALDASTHSRRTARRHVITITVIVMP